MDARRWYVLQCKPRECFRACEHLGNQGYTYFLPTLTREVLRRGKRDVAIEPLFPHYLFVQLDRVESNWAALRSTRGVSQLVRFGLEPLAVPDELVAALRAREAALAAGTDAGVQPLFQPGDNVQVLAGPLAGLQAVVEARDGLERVTLLITLLQKVQRLQVPVAQLKPL